MADVPVVGNLYVIDLRRNGGGAAVSRTVVTERKSRRIALKKKKRLQEVAGWIRVAQHGVVLRCEDGDTIGFSDRAQVVRRTGNAEVIDGRREQADLPDRVRILLQQLDGFHHDARAQAVRDERQDTS